MTSVSPEKGDVCPECVKRQGLCARHRKGVLPQLAQPWWYQLVGVTHLTIGQLAFEAMSPEARRIYNRKRTKAARRANAERARLAALDSLAA